METVSTFFEDKTGIVLVNDETRDPGRENVLLDLLNMICGLNEDRKDIGQYTDFTEATIYDEPRKQMYNNIMKIGVLYRKAISLLEPASNSGIQEGMKIKIKKWLHTFYSIVADMSTENNPFKKTSETEVTKYGTLRRALIWSREYIVPLEYIVLILNETQDLSGKSILDKLRQYIPNGNYKLHTAAQGIFEGAAVPMCKMVWVWLLFGCLKDPYNEFFIVESFQQSDYWNDKYHIRKESVPSTITDELALLILETGRMIHFITEISKEAIPQSQARKYFLEAQSEPHCGLLSLLMNEKSTLFYNLKNLCINHSQTLLKILKEKYELTKFFTGNYWYTFLALGNFGRYVLELIYSMYYTNVQCLELKNIQELIKHAVISTSPFCCKMEKEQESNYVTVNWKNYQNNDLLCDVMQISYNRGGTIRKIFSCFEPLHDSVHSVVWKMQQMQYSLSNQKKILLYLEKSKRFTINMDDSYKILFQTVSNLNQFVNHINHYIMNEIIEEGWKNFWKAYTCAETIDEVINVYGIYITDVLNNISENTNKAMGINLNYVRKLIRDIEEMVIQMEDELTNKDGKIDNKEIKAKAIIFKRNFEDAITNFLEIAAGSKSNENLKHLSNRINFNMYFKVK